MKSKLKLSAEKKVDKVYLERLRERYEDEAMTNPNVDYEENEAILSMLDDLIEKAS